MSICEHCRHYKIKKMNGKIISEYCTKEKPTHYYVQCNTWNRTLKSRLGLVKEEFEDD